jgi:hypothetical protein
MGSNLAAVKDRRGLKDRPIQPGEAAWRPPNGTNDGLKEAKKWEQRDPATRQLILDPDILEVDSGGPIPYNPDPDYVIDRNTAIQDGWGEIHADSYGILLLSLHKYLNRIFGKKFGNALLEDVDWLYVNKFDRSFWNCKSEGDASILTIDEFKKMASYQYPIYAFGYNWLQSNEVSGAALCGRIATIKKYWSDRKKDCKQVILVTHSMGGLVARACAKRIPDEIAGIVHGVMPALGAPVCYRRIACGTEASSPSNGMIANITAGKVADIAGRTSATTTPVLATAPGPLELLPTHLYPAPWLFATAVKKDKSVDVGPLFGDNPYDLYRDTSCWYRAIDPANVDPAGRLQGQVLRKIRDAIDQAEYFHRTFLGSEYHPNSFAFYGADSAHLSFGTYRWVANVDTGNLTKADLGNAVLLGNTATGGRRVRLLDGRTIVFEPSVQDVPGDGTVPHQSGAGPTAHVRGVFRTIGYDHQGSYGNEAMLKLTLHLVGKIIQRAK